MSERKMQLACSFAALLVVCALMLVIEPRDGWPYLLSVFVGCTAIFLASLAGVWLDTRRPSR